MSDGRHELRDVEQTTPTYPPVVTIRAPREFHHDDGSTYRRIDAGEFPICDWLDSTLVRDRGAPG